MSSVRTGTRIAVAGLICAGMFMLGPPMRTVIAGEPLLQGDAARGRDIYFQCLACHSVDANRVGPMHRGLFGRRAGSAAGFNYSSAMKSAGQNGLVWSEATLDTYLTNPAKLVPGNKMLFGGLADAQTRADVIAYLKQATATVPKSSEAAPK